MSTYNICFCGEVRKMHTWILSFLELFCIYMRQFKGAQPHILKEIHLELLGDK